MFLPQESTNWPTLPNKLSFNEDLLLHNISTLSLLRKLIIRQIQSTANNCSRTLSPDNTYKYFYVKDQGSHIYWKTWKNESTPGKTWKNHEILQKKKKIMEKLHGTWKNIWVDYKSLHARGRPQVLCVCLLSGGWNKCSILCMH